MITDYLNLRNVIIGFFVGIILYSILKAIFRKPSGFEKEYNDILNSEKFKAKGQWHKE